MTNEEKARELAIKYCKDIDSSGNECYNIGCELACNEAMQWKDEQVSIERKQLIEKANQSVTQSFENGAIFKKQQMIDKAAEWLRMTMDFFNNGEFNTEKFVNDFRQAMKGE